VIPALAYGLTFKKQDKAGQIQFYKGFLSTIRITHALKRLLNKSRPNGSDDSFPPGHVSAAFSSAVFLEKRIGCTYALPAYIGVACVGWRRVDSGEHITEDVVAGAVIGRLASDCRGASRPRQSR